MGKASANQGPSQTELHLRSELDRARREIMKLKKAAAGAAPPPGVAAPAPPVIPPVPAGATAPEAESLRQEVAELSATRQRLSRLYFAQVEENRQRALRLHRILEGIARVDSGLDTDALLAHAAEMVSGSLGFRVVLVRVREPGSDRLRARAFAGLDEAARAALAADVPVDEFRSWLKDEFRVSRSYFISHQHEFSGRLPAGQQADPGPREEWEWHGEDVLIVPLQSRDGGLVGYFSVDDPADRLVPSTETIELLELLGTHVVVAIENARLVRELEQQTRQLQESGERVRELYAIKGNFLSTISHELRTPITAIRAFLDTLLSASVGEIPADRLRHFLGIMNEEAQRLTRLVESMLDLNRLDSAEVRLERCPTDFADIVQDTVHLLGPVAEAGQVSLKLVSDCADTRLEADPDQMQQLVLHLGSNAIKFTPAGGSVAVFLSGTPDEIALRVEDTGIGIPETALEKVFERFYQVDSSLVRRFGGAGLGLAVCKSIVEWHGGRITAESAPGRGSCFTVVLPRWGGPRVALSDAPAPEAPADLLRLAIEMVAEVMDARVVSLLAPGPDGALVVRAAIGLDEATMRQVRVPVGSGVVGWVAEHRRPVCVADAGQPGEVMASGRKHYRTRTFLSVPLLDGETLLGVLNVTDPVSGAPFTPRDGKVLVQLAERMGLTWSVLRRDGEEAGEAARDAAARAYHRMLVHFERRRFEAPDRVRLARALAQELGLDEADIATVAFAAGVHDIGMTRLPGGLRESATPFSADERELMERHVELGADLLRPLEGFDAVREVVLSHHEWWNGTGYPRALRGEGIPVGARILTVVDAWESMTVGRPHRRAIHEGDAVYELRRRAGEQFDPRVVEAFERVLEAARPQTAAERQPKPDDANAIAGR
jgi:signal transduction histidine kinase/response regulator RpfG family c-di-GMP phosphodiesterase